MIVYLLKFQADLTAPPTFSVICDSNTGDGMLQSITPELQPRFRLVTTDESADIVVLLLSTGVLGPNGEPLRRLIEVLEKDKRRQTDRLVVVYSAHANNSAAIYSTEDGWDFAGNEKKSAPKEVQAALDQHEALTYRPKDGIKDHEFRALIDQLVQCLWQIVPH